MIVMARIAVQKSSIDYGGGHSDHPKNDQTVDKEILECVPPGTKNLFCLTVAQHIVHQQWANLFVFMSVWL